MLKRLFTAAFFLGLMNAGFGQEAKPAAPPTTTPQESRPTTPTPQEGKPSTPQQGAPASNQQTPGTEPVISRQMLEYYNRAKAAGMSDLDIEKAALERGFSREQIDRIKAKAAGEEAITNEPAKDRNDDSRQQEDEEGDSEETSEADVIDSLFTGLSASSRRGLRRFGDAFFSRFSSTFEPNLRIATPKNYILGPDDELIVDIYGKAVDHLRLKVSPEGSVKMYNLAPVVISGLTVEDATRRIVGRLREAYSGLNQPGSGTYVTVTLGDIRSIRVMVAGEAVKPGTYTVSSLASAFNALYSSGGPNANGSYRNIEVIRDQKLLRVIDLYKFLVNGDLKDNVALREDDIILIRPYEKQVKLMGEVKKRGIFELKEGETFKDLLNYAGGLTPMALTQKVNFKRNSGVSFEIGTFPDSAFVSFVPKNGDEITVPRIVNLVANFVSIEGAVIRPGIYPFGPDNLTIKELVTSALGTRPDAYVGRASLVTIGEKEAEIRSFDLGKLLMGEVEDIPLKLGDRVIIKSTTEIVPGNAISISGAVGAPGNYPFFKNLTIPDLIYQSGGFTQAGVAYRIEVSRRVKEDTLGIPAEQNVRIFTVNVNEDLTYSGNDSTFKLMPFDKVFVRRSPRYEPQRTVSIAGEVVFPGEYTILNNFERLSDLIPKAGGLKSAAYLSAARLIRDGEPVAVDLASILENPSSESNVLLKSGDELIIPTKSDIVRIKGAVQNPSLVNFNSTFKYRDYLSQAGGYSDYAWKKRVYISYPNGRTKRMTAITKILPGSTITVPEKKPDLEPGMSRTERIALLSMLVTTTIAIIRLF